MTPIGCCFCLHSLITFCPFSSVRQVPEEVKARSQWAHRGPCLTPLENAVKIFTIKIPLLSPPVGDVEGRFFFGSSATTLPHFCPFPAPHLQPDQLLVQQIGRQRLLLHVLQRERGKNFGIRRLFKSNKLCIYLANARVSW